MKKPMLITAVVVVLVVLTVASYLAFKYWVPIKMLLSNYQKVALNDVLQSSDKLNGKRVEYTGEFESMFETSILDGEIWLETTKNTIYRPNSEAMPGMHSGYRWAKVKVWGILRTGDKSGYGHLGAASYQITADKIELLEKIDFSNSLMRMPENGIYFQRGGFVSEWEGRILDFDSGTFKIYQNLGKVDSQEKPIRELVLDVKLSFSDKEIGRIDNIVKKAIEENFINKEPNADVDFFLQYYKNGQMKQTETYGPLPNSGAINDLFEIMFYEIKTRI